MILYVLDDTQRPLALLGTLTQTDGAIVGDPVVVEQLLHRPRTWGLDPMMFLDGWSNGYVSARPMP
jgi:hypothetical protein